MGSHMYFGSRLESTVDSDAVDMIDFCSYLEEVSAPDIRRQTLEACCKPGVGKVGTLWFCDEHKMQIIALAKRRGQ